MFFFSNFNGSWDQYVDSFTFAIPAGLDMFWKWNVRYPKSVALTPFHKYIQYNQLASIHFYNGYPLAASNDVKSARVVKDKLVEFDTHEPGCSNEQFQAGYNRLLRELQHDLGDMYPTTIMSMAAAKVEKRRGWTAATTGERLHG